MGNFVSDKELQAFFQSTSVPNAQYGFQETALAFGAGEGDFANMGGMEQFEANEDPIASLTSIGELLSLQNTLPPVAIPSARDDPSFLAIDPTLGSPSVSLADASWVDLTGQAFAPDLWNALPPWNEETQYPQIITASPPPDYSAPDHADEDDGDSSENGRKKRRRIPPNAKRLLEACFERRREDPYVPHEDIEELVKQTGLSAKQIRTFFANARARKLPRVSKGVDVPGSRSDHSQKDPMERFMSSSPEDEGISEDAVKAAADSVPPSHFSSHMTNLQRLPSRTNTISVSDTGFSSNSGSSSSQASIDSANSRGPRRGRKRQRESTQKVDESIVRKPSDPSKIYQCTFCTSDFAQKYDWKRHEESVHLPQAEWICMPDGATYSDKEGEACCVFCDEQDPNDTHAELHNCTACVKAPRDRRTFQRKDKLVQHLAQVHRCTQPPAPINKWKRPIQRQITIICGLCGLKLPDWTTRAEHISMHFTSGQSMYLWVLERGGGILPPEVAQSDWTLKRLSPAPTPNGEYPCDLCPTPTRFSQIPHIIFHTRQVHNKYSHEARDAMRLALPHHSKSDTLIEKPKLGFGTKLFLQNNSYKSTRFQGSANTVRERVERGTPLRGRRDAVGTGPPPMHRIIPMPTFTGVPSSRVPGLGMQEQALTQTQGRGVRIGLTSSRSLVPNPHADWRPAALAQEAYRSSQPDDIHQHVTGDLAVGLDPDIIQATQTHTRTNSAESSMSPLSTTPPIPPFFKIPISPPTRR